MRSFFLLRKTRQRLRYKVRCFRESKRKLVLLASPDFRTPTQWNSLAQSRKQFPNTTRRRRATTIPRDLTKRSVAKTIFVMNCTRCLISGSLTKCVGLAYDLRSIVWSKFFMYWHCASSIESCFLLWVWCKVGTVRLSMSDNAQYNTK